MKKLEEFLDKLQYDELSRLHKDLSSGGSMAKDLVKETLKRRTAAAKKSCATCGSKINLEASPEYSLVFGHVDFKKKATFCGLDCLEYFVGKLSELTNKHNTLKV